MRTRRTRKFRPLAFALNLVVALTVMANYHMDPLFYARAQGCDTCPPPLTDPDTGANLQQTHSWRQNSPVTVNINPYWPQNLRTCIENAFSNMNANGNAGVRFTNFTYNDVPPSGDNTVQVNWQGAGAVQATTFLFPRSDGSGLSRAVINIHPNVNDCAALRQALAHEIGHTFGLGDCPSCCAQVTVMTLAAGYNDTTQGRETPGPCDDDTINTNPRYDPSKLNPPQPNPPSSTGGSSGGSYNRGSWTGYSCYQWFQVTYYYTCYSSGCYMSGVTVQPASGVFCF